MYIPDSLPIPDPGSRIPDLGSRISDPKKGTKVEGEKLVVLSFFRSHKYHKIENYSIFELEKKKNQITKNYSTFCPQNFH